MSNIEHNQINVYAASGVTNDSAVPGTDVDDALNNLAAGTATVLFTAKPSASILNETGDGTAYDIVFNSEQIDLGGDFDTTTGKFTTPVAGVYEFEASILIFGLLSTHTSIDIAFISSLGGTKIYVDNAVTYPSGGGVFAASGSIKLNLDSAVDVFVRLSVGGVSKVVDIDPNSRFSGSLVHAV